MKKKLLTAAASALVGFLAAAQPWMMRPQGPANEFSAMEGTSVLNYNMLPERDIHSRAGYGPAFYIFPDGRLDNQQALELAQRLKLTEIVQEYGGRIMVVNPASDKWQDQDLEAFTRLIGMGGAPTNVKVVGIGSGATFVNRQLAATDLTGVIAGIVTIDGEPGKVCKFPVPAFIGGKNAAKAAKPYQAASDAAPADPLQKVVINTDRKASLEMLFAQAWDDVLSANYRYNNLFRTFYMSRGIDNPEGVKNFELVSIPVFDKLGIQRNVVGRKIRTSISGTSTFPSRRRMPPRVRFPWSSFSMATAMTPVRRAKRPASRNWPRKRDSWSWRWNGRAETDTSPWALTASKRLSASCGRSIPRSTGRGSMRKDCLPAP